jgi:hypothetical protein
MYIFTPNTLIESAKVNANYDELKAKTDYLSAPDTGWHYVGASGEPAFLNSWVNYDANGWTKARFRKDALGYVHIEGLVRSGANPSTIFVLPVGYRPKDGTTTEGLIFTICATDAAGRIDVKPNGNVYKNSAGATTFVSLAGITFKAEA